MHAHAYTLPLHKKGKMTVKAETIHSQMACKNPTTIRCRKTSDDENVPESKLVRAKKI